MRATTARRHGRAATKIFVNLPVKDLNRSVEFFTKLGYTFNPQFTDENATCMIVGDDIYVDAAGREVLQDLHAQADRRRQEQHRGAGRPLGGVARRRSNRIVETALAAGARRYAEPKDHGFMYQWGFEDLDGHIWEYFWMDPASIQG